MAQARSARDVEGREIVVTRARARAERSRRRGGCGDGCGGAAAPRRFDRSTTSRRSRLGGTCEPPLPPRGSAETRAQRAARAAIRHGVPFVPVPTASATLRERVRPSSAHARGHTRLHGRSAQGGRWRGQRDGGGDDVFLSHRIGRLAQASGGRARAPAAEDARPPLDCTGRSLTSPVPLASAGYPWTRRPQVGTTRGGHRRDREKYRGFCPAPKAVPSTACSTSQSSRAGRVVMIAGLLRLRSAVGP